MGNCLSCGRKQIKTKIDQKEKSVNFGMYDSDCQYIATKLVAILLAEGCPLFVFVRVRTSTHISCKISINITTVHQCVRKLRTRSCVYNTIRMLMLSNTEQ